MSAKPVVDGFFLTLQRLVDFVRENRDPCAAHAEWVERCEQAERRYNALRGAEQLKARAAWLKARRRRNKLKAKCARARARK